MKRVLITGAVGQLGRQLCKLAPAGIAPYGLTSRELDISDRAAVDACVASIAPELILNAAAYTAVDAAENDADRAAQVNADGPAWLAQAARRRGARLIHVSTDFVFGGTQPRPYAPHDETNPLGVYGRTKRDGEVRALAEHPDGASIVRTAWVYGPGGRNFVRTVLRILAERDEMRVVDDQIGTPTHTASLATAIWRIAAGSAPRIWHFTDSGVASWYDLAVAVRSVAAERWPAVEWGKVRPIPARDFPTPASRPACALLDKTATWEVLPVADHWQTVLERALTHDPQDQWLPEALQV